MDEPTSGLDPNQKHEVRAMIRQMAKDKTIILSTHNLEEVDAVCSRVIIIAEGRLMVSDTPAGLKARSSNHGAVRCTLKNIDKGTALKEVRALAGVASADVVEVSGSEVSIRAYPKEPSTSFSQDILRCLRGQGYEVEKLFVEEGRLDDVFRKITLSKDIS